ncbi:InlB B-repeat-containing protein [Candidatus Saccharibacteria bacterium]|nr:InlB B-repeat-containing protein [Candidatus Saccharibacteria bacterium]
MITRLLGYIRRLKNPAYSSIALAAFSLLSLFLYPCFLPSRSYADTPEVTPSITIGNSGSLAFSVDPGSFAYGRQDITVLTTNYTGYTLTAVPSSNDPRLANSVTGSYISSIASNTTQSGFSANEYGFSTDTTIDSSTTYHPVTASTVIKTTNTATTTAQAGTFQLTIGAKAGSNTPAGTYTRQFTLTATANEAAFSVTYNANAGQDTVSNMPTSPQTSGTVVGPYLNLASEVPERANYTFLGWDTNSSATTATYQPGTAYALDQTIQNQVTLYAIWESNYRTLTVNYGSQVTAVKVDGTTIANGGTVSLLKNTDHAITATFSTGYYLDAWTASGATVEDSTEITTTLSMGTTNATLSAAAKKIYLQEITAKQCRELGTSASVTAYDQRDEQAYTIRYINGNCWMTKDLAYGSTPYYTSVITARSACQIGSWSLPTYEQAQTLFNNTDYATAFNIGTGYGTAWTSTLRSSSRYYGIQYMSKRIESTSISSGRNAAVRCILLPSTVNLTVNYGTHVSEVYVDGSLVADGATISIERNVNHAIEASFDSGYTIHSWIVNGSTQSSPTNPITLNLSSDTSLTVNAATLRTVTVNYPTGVSAISVDGNTVSNGSTLTMAEGSSHPIRITLDTNYALDSWATTTGGTIASATSTSTTFTMGTNDGTLSASTISPRTITVQYGTGISSVSVGGTIVANNGTILVKAGGSYTIVATASSDYIFASWSATSGTITSTTAESTNYKPSVNNATLTATAVHCLSITGDMQNAQASKYYCDGATGTMTDRRTTTGTGASSNLTYTIAKIDGKLWMTQNLAITGTIPASGSNFSSPSTFNVSQYDLTNTTYCIGTDASDSNPLGYTNVCSHYSSGNSNTGNKPTAWYNFAAVSAGSVTGISNSSLPSRDICPSGWQIPDDYADDCIKNYPQYGGRYQDGSLNTTDEGYWWKRYAFGSGNAQTQRSYTNYDGKLWSGGSYRYYGLSIRCVRKE